MEREITNIGTNIKYSMSLECGGLDSQEFDFTAMFFTFSNKSISIAKSEMVLDSESSQYIASIDTTLLSEGEIKCQVTASIPDSDVEGGYRTEIATIHTGIHLRRKVGK